MQTDPEMQKRDLNNDVVNSSKDFISIFHFLLVMNDEVILESVKNR